MNQFEELIHELNIMSIPELEDFRENWLEELRRKRMPEIITDFCGHIIDQVIVRKWEVYISMKNSLPNFHMMSNEEELAIMVECKQKHPERYTPKCLAEARKFAELPCNIPGLR
ncbi:MAG: hypothetical protein MR936_15010 [Eubacterium sp.]|nr:hypothetical protein [Eubacterium sp.]